MTSFVLICAAWFVVASASPAYAYIDPGTGGMLMQVVLAGVTGAAVLARMYWRRLTALLRMRPPDREPR